MSGGGGEQALVGKWGRVPDGEGGGDQPNFRQLGGTSPVPQGEKTLQCQTDLLLFLYCKYASFKEVGNQAFYYTQYLWSNYGNHNERGIGQ